jgi:hypothetical protein
MAYQDSEFIAAIMALDSDQREPTVQIGEELEKTWEVANDVCRAVESRSNRGVIENRTISPQDRFITSSGVAEVVGCSMESARRRIRKLEDDGILRMQYEGRVKGYIISDKYRDVEPNTDRVAKLYSDMMESLYEPM